MNGEGNNNSIPAWAGVILGVLGMLGSIAAAWMMFESRITAVEQTTSFSMARLDRIETKLDRLIENERSDK